MRVAAVYTLPFHRWVLADTVRALRALGVEVVELVHEPDGHHDWAQNNGGLLANLRHLKPDVLLLADYPYGPFQSAAGGCPVYATRHSLAARGNTYAPEQRTANGIATWSAMDRRLLAERLGTTEDDPAFLDVGCPWAGELLAYPTSHTGPPGWTPADPSSRDPVVAWCPTWNDWSPNVADQLLGLQGVRLVYRPHYATAWRWPRMLDWARDVGFEIDDPLGHPAGLLVRADVLVTDVSGIALLALAVPDAGLPVVQVEPSVETGAQIEKWGPEWTLRGRIGDRVEPAGVREAVERYLLGEDPELEDEANTRRMTRRTLFGNDPLPGGLTPGERLAREIAEGR